MAAGAEGPGVAVSAGKAEGMVGAVVGKIVREAFWVWGMNMPFPGLKYPLTGVLSPRD